MMDNRHFIKIIREQASPLKPIPTGLEASGSLSRPVRAVLFDLYGTLFISGSGDITVAEEQVKRDRLASLLSRHDLSDDPDRVQKSYVAAIQKEHEKLRAEGVDYPEVIVENIWKTVLGCGSDEQARAFAVAYESMFNPVWPMPHLPELLDSLQSLKLVMGIVSNAQFFTPLLFDAFIGSTPAEIGFTDELALYSYAYGFAKPSAFLFETAQRRLAMRGIDASEVLFVGNDMLNDVYAAKMAGFQTALFAGDKRSLRLRTDDERCSVFTPDLTVIDLLQLSEALKVQTE
jgi:putative hydrolase of the HAD superfamily